MGKAKKRAKSKKPIKAKKPARRGPAQASSAAAGSATAGLTPRHEAVSSATWLKTGSSRVRTTVLTSGTPPKASKVVSRGRTRVSAASAAEAAQNQRSSKGTLARPGSSA